MPVTPKKVKGGYMLAEPSGALSSHRASPGPLKTVAAQAGIINRAIAKKSASTKSAAFDWLASRGPAHRKLAFLGKILGPSPEEQAQLGTEARQALAAAQTPEAARHLHFTALTLGHDLTPELSALGVEPHPLAAQHLAKLKLRSSAAAPATTPAATVVPASGSTPSADPEAGKVAGVAQMTTPAAGKVEPEKPAQSEEKKLQAEAAKKDDQQSKAREEAAPHQPEHPKKAEELEALQKLAELLRAEGECLIKLANEAQALAVVPESKTAAVTAPAAPAPGATPATGGNSIGQTIAGMPGWAGPGLGAVLGGLGGYFASSDKNRLRNAAVAALAGGGLGWAAQKYAPGMLDGQPSKPPTETPAPVNV